MHGSRARVESVWHFISVVLVFALNFLLICGFHVDP